MSKFGENGKAISYRHVYEVDGIPLGPPGYMHVNNVVVLTKNGIRCAHFFFLRQRPGGGQAAFFSPRPAPAAQQEGEDETIHCFISGALSAEALVIMAPCRQQQPAVLRLS